MTDLHATVLGEGQPMIILHGFLGMGDNWKTLGNKFAEAGYEVHLIDQRNHGRSPHTNEMSYPVMAKDIKEYCEKNHLENIILLGHSMGGKVAMFAAVDFGSLIEKLVVVDISPKYYSPHHQEILDALTALEEKAFTSRGEAEDFLADYIEDEGTRLFLLKNLYRKNGKILSLRLNLEVLKEKVNEVGEALPAGKQFDKPVLFIKGGRSNYITSEDKPLIELHFPNAQIKEISGAGHWVHAEKMNEFYKEIVNFISN